MIALYDEPPPGAQLFIECTFWGIGVERLAGSRLEDQAWEQATLPGWRSGLGLRGTVVSADAAYVASRAATHGLCKALREDHPWGSEPGAPLGDALARLRERLRLRSRTPLAATLFNARQEKNSKCPQHV